MLLRPFFFITWFTDFFKIKLSQRWEKKKIIGGKKREKRPTHQEELAVFLIDYQYFFIYFFILTGIHIRGEKKKTKTIFFLKMAKIQVKGVHKPRNNKKAQWQTV